MHPENLIEHSPRTDPHFRPLPDLHTRSRSDLTADRPGGPDTVQPKSGRLPRAMRPIGLSLASAWLAACGSGGDSGGGNTAVSAANPAGNPAANPADGSAGTGGSAAPSNTGTGTSALPSEKQAARFLSQAALGNTIEDVQAITTRGFVSWLDDQMAMATDTSRWDWLAGNGYLGSNPAATAGLDNMLWRKLMASPDTLRQRVTVALSEIFVVGATVTSNFRQFAIAAYVDTLEQHAFGNFRALLEAVTLNPAMGLWLNMLGNRREDPATGRVPDENYAREVMQLFTIGLYRLNPDGSTVNGANGLPLESYNQNDIQGLARVFTGWTYGVPRTNTLPDHMRAPMTLVAGNHSTLEKQFLGVTIAAGTDGRTSLRIALDTLAGHPNVGPFIGRQLIQRLVTSNPSAAYIARVGRVFADNGRGVRGDMAAVVRAVLLDTEARDDTRVSDPAWGKLREPMLRYIQWARTFKATSASGAWNIGSTSDPATRLGQSPMRSPSVFNFFRPGYVPPNTALGARRLTAPELQITNESSTIGYVNFMQQAISTGIGDVRATYEDWLSAATDGNTLVSRIALLLATEVSARTLDQIRSAVATMPAVSTNDRLRRVQAAVLLVMASSDYLVQK